MASQHACDFLHRVEAGAHRPAAPLSEMAATPLNRDLRKTGDHGVTGSSRYTSGSRQSHYESPRAQANSRGERPGVRNRDAVQQKGRKRVFVQGGCALGLPGRRTESVSPLIAKGGSLCSVIIFPRES